MASRTSVAPMTKQITAMIKAQLCTSTPRPGDDRSGTIPHREVADGRRGDADGPDQRKERVHDRLFAAGSRSARSLRPRRRRGRVLGVGTPQHGAGGERLRRRQIFDRAHPLRIGGSAPARGRPLHCFSATSTSSAHRTRRRSSCSGSSGSAIEQRAAVVEQCDRPSVFEHQLAAALAHDRAKET